MFETLCWNLVKTRLTRILGDLVKTRSRQGLQQGFLRGKPCRTLLKQGWEFKFFKENPCIDLVTFFFDSFFYTIQ